MKLFKRKPKVLTPEQQEEINTKYFFDMILPPTIKFKSDFYYVSMAQAWLVATAVAKCREQTMTYMHNNSLDDVTFNKAVQKCIESRRIDDDTKAYLRTLKR